ncbi:MAG: FAD-binding oxidoreductase [Nitrososphaeria archaeon]
MEYNKVTPKIIEELKEIFGEKNVLTSAEELEPYSYDEGGKQYRHMPDVVVKAENEEQIMKLMKLANREHIPVTPRGAGSGLAGGAVALYGGIVLSLEKMNRILEIDEVNMVAVCEPGVVTNDLCKAVAEKGLFYAGYPMSTETSYIGSNVATNAGGSKVIKYGSTRSHVLGLEVITPTGEKLVLGGKRRKETSGYSLLHLMIGSEGTLGIVTKVIVNLMPAPNTMVDLLIPFAKFNDAVKASSNIIVTTKVYPISMEFMDRFGVNFVTEKLNLPKLPAQDTAEAYLLITLEGKNQEELDTLSEKAGTAALEMGALDVFVASSKTESERLWNIRIKIPDVMLNSFRHLLVGDVVVPRSEITEFIEKSQKIIEKYQDVQASFLGHIGDGNIHPMAIDTAADRTDEDWIDVSDKLYGELCLLGAQMGGTVSGEHGIGFVKKNILAKSLGEYTISVMRGIKRAFDPNFILNPGKIFDPE